MPAPSNILVHFDEGEPPIHCDSVAALDAVLDRLHAATLDRLTRDANQCPLQVSIEFDQYGAMTGLGSALTFVMVGTEDDWYYARGDQKAEEPKEMFYGAGQDSYWAPRNLIPLAVARDAIRYFIEHRRPSTALEWDN
jgi:hypothetical protein